MNRAQLWLLLVCCGCGGQTRSYDVIVDTEQLCRMFDPTPENCALTNGPAVHMTLTIEDRNHNKAILYGRSDTTADRVYLAEVPRTGRYEVVENREDDANVSGCVTTSRLTVALDVDERGLNGGEENRTEENAHCNTLKQHRVTRRLREWKGSRVVGEQNQGVLPAFN